MGWRESHARESAIGSRAQHAKKGKAEDSRILGRAQSAIHTARRRQKRKRRAGRGVYNAGL